MYVNFKYLTLKPSSVFNLLAIKQKETSYLLENLSQEEYSHFQTLSFITHIRQKKKEEHPYISLRLSKKGLEFLEKLEEAEILEEDEKIFDWLVEHYNKLGKQIGNRARTKRHLRDFRIKSGLEKNNLLRVFIAFLGDEENMDYNNILEFSLYKPLTAFQTRFQLEDSRVYKFYIKHKFELEKSFEEY